MDSSSTSFLEFIVIGFLLVYLGGKLLGFRRRVRGKSGKRAFSSHKASKGNAQRLAPTERQIALVDTMRKEGLLSDLEKRMIPANQSRSFYGYLIDRHIEEHDKLAAEHEEAQMRQEASATVDSSGEQGKWLDLDHLPPVDELPIEQRGGLFSKREYAFFKVLHRACGKQGLTVCPKVRVMDILEVKTDDPDENTVWFRTLAQLHIDFMILGKNDRFLFGIELDDSTHCTDEARKKDNLKDCCFMKAGIPLFRCQKVMNDEEMGEWLDKRRLIAEARRELHR